MKSRMKIDRLSKADRDTVQNRNTTFEKQDPLQRKQSNMY